MGTLLQDLRYALRMLMQRPGFTAVAILTLALGIGANSAIFSVVYSVLLRPLPYPQPNELVVVHEGREGAPRQMPASPPDFLDYRSQNTTLQYLAAYSTTSVALAGDAEPEHLSVARVSASLFPMLGVNAVRGRVFLAEEEEEGAGKVVLLGHKLWQTRFGGDAAILGRSLELDGKSFTVVGILPRDFSFPERETDVWVPLAFTVEERSADARGGHYLPMVGRLKDGVSLEAANADIGAVSARISKDNPDSHAHLSAGVGSLLEETVGKLRPALLALLGAVALVLLIACANLANLLLARATDRQREVAVRTALGASRGRLIRQLLTESVVLSVLGGAVGLLFAFWGVDVLVRMSPTDTPRLSEIRVDGVALLYTFAVAVLTGVGFGVVPALASTRTDLTDALKDAGAKGTDGRTRNRTRSALVVAEVALAMLLLVGAGLVLESFMRLRKVDPGFDPTRLLTFRTSLPDSKYPEDHPASLFYDAALERLAALPGVESVATASPMPVSGTMMTLRVKIDGQEPTDPKERRSAVWRAVSPSYFRTMRQRLVKGRVIGDADRKGTPPVLVINETMARNYFKDADPIGRRVEIGYDDMNCEVIGVVADAKNNGLRVPAREEMYTSHRQTSLTFADFVLRTTAEPRELAEAARREILVIDPAQPIYDVRLMEERLADSIAQQRFETLMFVAFASVALALAVVGIYAVMAIAVVQRTRELGIRMALGARPRDVVRLVVGHGMLLTVAGVAVGLLMAGALSRVLTSLLFGVSPLDPKTFAAVPFILAAVAMTACYLPARRAARIDPMNALRHE